MSNLMPYRHLSPVKGSIFGDDFFKPFFYGESNASAFRVDVRDKGDSYALEAELPGVKREDISLDVDDGVLTISAEWKSECKNGECSDYLISERRSGHVRRSFSLENVREDDITAEYSDGVLHVTMPKRDKEQRKSRKIELN